MLSVLSYNVHFGRRLDKIIYWLLQKPIYDVMCFQEFPKQAIPLFLKAFARADYGYRFAPFLKRRRTTFGELTLFRKDKLTLMTSSTVSLGINSGEKMLLRTRIPRTSLLTMFRYKKHQITVANVHLVSVAFNALRYKQILKIVNRLNGHKMPTVLLGDFNIPGVFGRRKLNTLMEECGYTILKKRFSTYHLAILRHQMDYIFWKGCNVSDLFIERVKFSDHYPLAFRVSVRISSRSSSNAHVAKHTRASAAP